MFRWAILDMSVMCHHVMSRWTILDMSRLDTQDMSCHVQVGQAGHAKVGHVRGVRACLGRRPGGAMCNVGCKSWGALNFQILNKLKFKFKNLCWPILLKFCRPLGLATFSVSRTFFLKFEIEIVKILQI